MLARSERSQQKRFTLRPQNLALRWEGIEFQLSPEMEPVTIQLERGVTISGRVLDPEGNPVSAAQLR